MRRGRTIRVIVQRLLLIGLVQTRIWVPLDVAGVVRGGMRRQDALYVLIRGVRHAAVRHEVHGAVALADTGHGTAGHHVAVVVRDRHRGVATLHLR